MSMISSHLTQNILVIPCKILMLIFDLNFRYSFKYFLYLPNFQINYGLQKSIIKIKW